MPDDYSADVRTTGSLKVGGSATGEIETAGDRDWFAVTFKAGRIYRIDIEGHDAGGGALAVPKYLGLYKPNGYFATREMTIKPGGCYQPEADVTYYLEVGEGGSGTGGYRLSVAEVPDDFAADTRTAGAVAVGGSTTGELEHGDDRDWFKVTLEAGKTYQVDLKGSATGDGTLADPNLSGIYDANGKPIDATWNDDGGTGRNSRVTFTADRSGTYYIEADASTDYSGDISPWMGTYTLSVAEVTDDAASESRTTGTAGTVDPADDFAADTGTAGAVAVGGSATGEIEAARDRDWFAVTLEAGTTYVVDLKGRKTGDGTLRDPYLFGIHDADGARLAGTRDDNGGAGRNSRLTFTPDESGTYHVAAGAKKKLEGTYTLSVTEVTVDEVAADPADDYAADTGTGGAVAVGGSATGEIEAAGDSDWFAVTLEAGTTYVVDLKGRATGDGTLRDPHLDGVYDADGVYISGTWDDDGGTGRNSRSIFTPEEDGTYHVAAGANGKGTGSYTLSVVEIPDDFAADTGTAGTVAVGGSAMGEIEAARDSDWFAVTLEAGKTYVVDGTAATAPWGTRIWTGSTMRTASTSPVPRTTTAARGATAARSSHRTRTAPTMWRPAPTEGTPAATRCRSKSGTTTWPISARAARSMSTARPRARSSLGATRTGSR